MRVTKTIVEDVKCPVCKKHGKSEAYSCAACERLICDHCFVCNEQTRHQVICNDCRSKGVESVTPNKSAFDQWLEKR